MTTNKPSKIIIAVLAIVLMFSALTAAAYYDDEKDEYVATESTQIINNVVYEKVTPSGKGAKPYYVVESFSQTRKIAQSMKEINIVSHIDGIPVTEINGNLLSVNEYMIHNIYACMDNKPFEYPNVTKINLPESVTVIGDGAFIGLINIKDIKLPSKLTSLGAYAFYELKNITEITLPKGIEKIAWSTFYGCTNLKSITFEGGIKSVGDMAFSGCKNLRSFPECDFLKAIGDEAFYGCSKIKSVYLPETLEKLGYGAFAKTDLRSVTVPSKAKFGSYDEDRYGEYGTFGGCKKLKTVVFENRKDEMYLENTFNGCTALETVVLPASAKAVNIFPRAFKNCKNLTTIVNSERIGCIREAGFANCKGLKSLKLSSKTAFVENKAFYGCSKLASVTYTGTKTAPDLKGKSVFAGTPNGIKFIVKNTTVAKKLKVELKNTGVKNAKIYIGPSYKLAYKNVK